MSLLVQRPEDARALYLFAHGAGAGMHHAFMQQLSDALASKQIATARFEFAYRTRGVFRPDPAPVLEAEVRAAALEAAGLGLPMIAGGKSMGGRITSQAQAHEPLPGVRGLVFVGFPLHTAGKPATKRADHLAAVRVPMLFLQGTRDKLAELPLLEPIVRKLPQAALHVIPEADHGFHVPKRTGRTDAEVIDELAAQIAAFAERL